MNRLTQLIVLALFAAPAAQALEHKLNFDQGVSAVGVVTQAKENIKAASHRDGFDARPLFDREERDCTTVSFRNGDPMRSERIQLESRIYREVCHHIPDYPRDRDYPRGPGRGHRIQNVTPESGEFQTAGQECHERWERTERRSVRVEISGRGEMLPWERDTFQVCLQGQWLSASSIDSSHEYDINTPGWSGDTVIARALRKRQSEPDPNGITETGFAYDAATGNFKFELNDRWLGYYQDENVAITVLLKRYHKNWFDGTVLEKEITVKASELYTIRFADYAEELKGDLSPGKQYYVKWRFKRIGKVSKDSWQKYRESGKAAYEGLEIKALLTAGIQ